MQDLPPPRRIWLALEGQDIVELKQALLDRDPASAASFFQHIVVPRVRAAARLRGIRLDDDRTEESHERVPG